MYPIFTKSTAEKIIRSNPGILKTSLDLGISSSEIKISEDSAVINGHRIEFKDLAALKDDFLFIIDDNGEIKRVVMFSDETNIYYKLSPTMEWPTLKLSSVPMHRHIDISPRIDTESKIAEISPVKGKVLDTCCGLGYTAIMAAKHADEVFVFERDKNVIHVASFNAFSQELFTNKKIHLKNESVYDAITDLEDRYFDRVVHDPPTYKISPELYSDEFYSDLFRVMKKGAILYHYAPWPGKTKGKVFYLKIIKGLKNAGFSKVEYHDKSSGVRAIKE